MKPFRTSELLVLLAASVLAGCASAPAALLPGHGAEPNAEVRTAAAALVVPPTHRTTVRPLFLTHYMPWFQAPPVSKGYGWHWHMGFYDPYEEAADGTRPLATHDYPLTGPYDSSDPRILEEQLMTMKAAGIDGVIIDWYGPDPGLDYAAIHKASQILFEAVKKAGLIFAVCYEDQSIAKLVQARKFPQTEAVTRAAGAFRWMEDHWFHDAAYLKIDGRPVVLNFGPQEFRLWSDWETILSPCTPRPWFLSLEDHAEHDADGFYNWPAMAASIGGVLSLDTLVDQLNTFYAKTKDAGPLVATAWPGFHDNYQEAGVATSYGFLDDHQGATFRLTLGAALAARPEVVQLATWNDYGEGTVLEPNRTRGYGPLEDLQRVRRALDPAFAFTAEDLRRPLAFWRSHPEGASGAETEAVAAWLAGDPTGLRSLVP